MEISRVKGAAVINKKYGEGFIVQADGSRITVKFENTEKEFQFPDALENGKFIKLKDNSLQQEVNRLCEEQKLLKKQETERKAKEKEEAEKARLAAEKNERKASGERQIPVKKILSYGEVFRTHADAINDCFGFSHKSYQLGYKRIDDSYAVWFPGIAVMEKGKYRATSTSEGWVNILSDGGTKLTQYNEAAEKNKDFDPDNYRDIFVFAKYDEAEYRFIGVFKLITTEDTFDGITEFIRIGTKVDLHKMMIIE